MNRPFYRWWGVRLLGFSLLFLLIYGGQLISGGKSETKEIEVLKPVWTITAPAAALPGDCISVLFISDLEFSKAKVRLLSPSGKLVAVVAAFDARPGDGQGKAAILGLETTLEEGSYSLEATALLDGEPLKSVTPLAIGKGIFLIEEIKLDAKNTAIKTDTSKERLLQIDRLNKILFTQNQDATRFYGPFRLPLDSKRRTSTFGDRRTYIYPNGNSITNIHYGVDFGVPDGTPVFSSGDGKVVLAEKRNSTGWTLVIEHLPGVYSLYYHLDTLLAATDELVRAGSLIARSGSTGLATGPHLHWEFRVNGEAVSPDYFVDRKLF